MSKIDDLVAQRIGALELTNMKQALTIEQLSAQVQRLTEENAQLKISPELPMRKETANGHAKECRA